MTVNDVLNYDRIIRNIIDNVEEVNSLTKFKFLGMLKQFEPIVLNFNTIQNDKIKKYGTQNAQGELGVFVPNIDDYSNEDDYKNAYSEFEATIEKISDELNEVLESEVNLDIKKFKSDDVIDVGIPSDYLVAIYDLIEE